jgi:hypothetical protein
VLYWITMQESGISKRVAVRFEDWPEENTPASDGEGEVHGNGRVNGTVAGTESLAG